MSEKELIEFLGYEWSAKAILRYPFPGAMPFFWDRDSLANRRDLLSSTGAHMDVTEKVLAEWPEAPPAKTEREERLELALREIKARAVPDMTWLASEAIIKRIGEIADEALRKEEVR